MNLYIEEAIDENQGFLIKKIKKYLINYYPIVPDGWNPWCDYEVKDFAPTVTCNCASTVASPTILLKCLDGVPTMTFNDKEVRESMENKECKYRIRKLTPEEYWKLMGLTVEDVQKARDLGISDSELYHQAGNGLVTNCVAEIFEHMYKAFYDNSFTCTDENFSSALPHQTSLW